MMSKWKHGLLGFWNICWGVGLLSAFVRPSVRRAPPLPSGADQRFPQRPQRRGPALNVLSVSLRTTFAVSKCTFSSHPAQTGGRLCRCNLCVRFG